MRFLYAHGFASGPASKKGVALQQHFAARGDRLELLDLRVPSFEHLRFSRMLEVVRGAIDGPAVLLGSSLGALTVARVAEKEPRVVAVVLLAPAFRLGERWRRRLAPEELEHWRQTGWLEVFDHARAAPGRVDYGFLTDLEAVDDGWPEVRVPVLAIHGRGDQTVDIQSTRAFAAPRPNVRLVEVDDGHELVASLPVIEREVDAFLAPWLSPGSG